MKRDYAEKKSRDERTVERYFNVKFSVFLRAENVEIDESNSYFSVRLSKRHHIENNHVKSSTTFISDR